MARDDEFAELVATLLRSEIAATSLNQQHLTRLISAAAIEAALQWDGLGLGSTPKEIATSLVRMKLRLSLAPTGTPAIALFPKGRSRNE